MIVAIIGAEIAFWLFVFTGLWLRYGAGAPRLGAALLFCTPVIDLVLLVFIVVDLRGGAAPHWSHGLGAMYLGFSVVFGRRLIAFADRRYAARRSGVVTEPKARLYGSAQIADSWKETGIFWLAIGLSAVILLVCAAIVGDTPGRAVILYWIGPLTVAGLIALIWPVSYMIWPSRPEQTSMTGR